ncbi:hypothetical protein H5410_060021 [Solanum commersonii]|uniref:MBD domain-containing protein n=1 Tax=Solanum commersonii TaxID=4109 RepID=A0A9J5W4E0_SOLCO|nr:hypothetical protein H5410_060021 [Solanum commersonii]
MDAYYFTPSWKKLRSFTQLDTFLQQHLEFNEIKLSNFIFTSSTIMEDTIPSTTLLANSNMKVQIVTL